jgi:hypothetical protein
MKLILTQPEIEQILRTHVNNTVTLANGNDFKIDFVATRSDDGITATIDIPYLGVQSIPAIAAAAETTPQKQVTPRKNAKANAAAVLGGGTTPATDSAANPEAVVDPVQEDSEEDDTQEGTQEAASAAQESTGTDAEPEPSSASQAPAETTSRGPSLFSGSAFVR